MFRFFALCALLFLIALMVTPALAMPPGVVFVQETPPPDVPPVDDAVAAFLSLSVMVAGVVESVKRVYIKPLAVANKWTDLQYNRVVYGLAVLFGIGAAVLAGREMDFFALIGVDGLPWYIGIIASGIVISFGENFAHHLLDASRNAVGLLKSWQTSNVPLLPVERIETARIEALDTSAIAAEIETKVMRNITTSVARAEAARPPEWAPPVPSSPQG